MHISAHVLGTMFSECPDTRMNKMQALSSRHWSFREDNGRVCKNGERDIGGKGKVYLGRASEKKWSMKISWEEENQNRKRPFQAQGHSSMSRDVEVNSMTCADNYNLWGLEGATEEYILYFCLSFWD